MTDSELIKALEKSINTYNEKGVYVDTENLQQQALELIKRQKSELEAIKDERAMVFKLSEEQLNKVNENLLKSIEYNEREIKAEAYKEFADKVKQELMPYDLGAFSAVRAVLKDLTGDDTNDLQIL